MIIGYLGDKNSSISPIVPSNVAKLKAIFDEILVEPGIGDGAFYSDDSYSDVRITSRPNILSEADVIVKITPDLTPEEYKQTKAGAIFLGQYAPFADASVQV